MNIAFSFSVLSPKQIRYQINTNLNIWMKFLIINVYHLFMCDSGLVRDDLNGEVLKNGITVLVV